MRRRLIPRLFLLTGVALVLLSVAPTVIGMINGMNQRQREDVSDAISAGVALAFHPAFIGSGLLGLCLILLGGLILLGVLKLK